MKKKLLNNYNMNEALCMLKESLQKKDIGYFKVQCDNCTLSIVTENIFGKNTNTIEISLRSVDDSKWIELEMSDGYIEDRPIIKALPLICFPAFITQFKSLKAEAFSEVWDAWDTITLCM